ncbi:MAG: hypothetical protein P4M11_08605 [Candidatus Pacebacteria bacterium]|nr:hypothetical protein [Candidatus Paceibacterota bacterium]
MDAVKTMKAQGKSPFRDEIHDVVHEKIKYADFLKAIDEMVAKQILRTTDKLHYDLH